MHLQRTIRRGLRRLVQLYADTAQAHTARGHTHAAKAVRCPGVGLEQRVTVALPGCGNCPDEEVPP
ncbi:hypothetical protein [Streptomyces sp. NPDC051286]|uniref:hypothetical protein n=1 Tax=Streptomyces sp. NPDC051286 TaxID=3365647 RepID=UPI0037A7B4BC